MAPGRNIKGFDLLIKKQPQGFSSGFEMSFTDGSNATWHPVFVEFR